MTRQAVQHYTHKFVDIDKSLFSMPVPPGTDEIVAMVDDLMATYPSSLTFPQISTWSYSRFSRSGRKRGAGCGGSSRNRTCRPC